MTTTTLYRLWNSADELLYVGIAGNPGRRFGEHARDKAWWSEVDRVTLRHFDSREAADRAETMAILQERPRYNVAKKGSSIEGLVPMEGPDGKPWWLPPPAAFMMVQLVQWSTDKRGYEGDPKEAAEECRRVAEVATRAFVDWLIAGGVVDTNPGTISQIVQRPDISPWQQVEVEPADTFKRLAQHLAGSRA